jgi:phosphoenolpyruvate-protein kinase (PTS system EI component)
MNLPTRFRGLPVSEGTAAGRLHIAEVSRAVSAAPDEVRDAFAAVSAERFALAERLRGAGREQEAAIIEVGALIAADPALTGPAVAAVLGGDSAAAAVREAAEKQAAVLEGLANRELAERAGDIRQVADAVLEHLSRAGTAPRPAGDFILIRHEVSAADLIELAEAGLVGAVSVAGGASSHAAIIARGLGVPMIAGTDPAVLAAPAGERGILDADAGELIVGAEAVGRSTAGRSTAGRSTAARSTAARSTAARNGGQRLQPGGPARTADGREITVLCNVASAAETRRGLAAGATGVGLLRTEIPYAEALAWPTLAEQRSQLIPILSLLAGRTATVRLLDFSGDKVPPFLRRGPSSADAGPADAGPPYAGQAGPRGEADGLAALLAHRTALPDQLRAVLEAGRGTSLAVLIPMVSSLGEVSQVREVLTQSAAALGADLPRLGIMVELQATAAAAATFAPAVDFFSIGTNDLTGQVLGLDRRDPAAKPALAAHPRVLALIAQVADAGRRAGIPVSVCGDSAADPLVLPLLVGLGVDTLSVPAARVQRVRSWLTELNTPACTALAARALRTTTADEVWTLVPPL